MIGDGVSWLFRKSKHVIIITATKWRRMVAAMVDTRLALTLGGHRDQVTIA